MTVSDKAMFPTVTPPPLGPSRRPWRVRDREHLLLWFKTADFKTPETVLAIRRLTSHRARRFTARGVGPERWISAEWNAQHPMPTAQAKLIAACRGLRDTLLAADAEYDRVRKAPASKRDVTNLGGYLDVLSQLLADVSLNFERSERTGESVWPLTQARYSRSLVGELALAEWLELLNAVDSFVCPVCARVELVTAGRAWPRKVCRDPACERRWRREHKAKEDRAKVAARMRRWRKR